MEVTVFTGSSIPGTSEVTLRVEEGASCDEVIAQILEGESVGKGAWHLMEEWQGCSKCSGNGRAACECISPTGHSLAPNEPVPLGGVVNLHLKRSDPTREVMLEPLRNHRRKKSEQAS